MITAIIEMPQGSLFKYERCKKDGLLMIDRPLNQPVPYNYGYIPDTLCGDGDPLDVFVINEEPIHPLTKVKIEIVGALRCTDNGDSDDKILAFIVGDKERPDGFGSQIIANYLQSYKTGFIVHEFVGRAKAEEIYKAAIEAYNETCHSGI